MELQELRTLLINHSEYYDDISLSQITIILIKVFGRFHHVDDDNRKYKFHPDENTGGKWIEIDAIDFDHIKRMLLEACEVIKPAGKLYNRVIKLTSSNMLWIHFTGTLKNNSEIKLDKNSDIMCLNNGVLDFRNYVFRKGEFEDGCYMSSYIDFLEPTKEDMAALNDYLNKVFPNPLMKEHALNVFSDCLSLRYTIGDASGDFRPTIFSNETDDFSVLIQLIFGEFWTYKNADTLIYKGKNKKCRLCIFDGNSHDYSTIDLIKINSLFHKKCVLWYQDDHKYQWHHYIENAGYIPKILNVIEFAKVELDNKNARSLAQSLIWVLFQTFLKNSKLKETPRVDYHLSSYKYCIRECGCKICRDKFISFKLILINLVKELCNEYLIKDIASNITRFYMIL